MYRVVVGGGWGVWMSRRVVRRWGLGGVGSEEVVEKERKGIKRNKSVAFGVRVLLLFLFNLVYLPPSVYDS